MSFTLATDRVVMREGQCGDVSLERRRVSVPPALQLSRA